MPPAAIEWMTGKVKSLLMMTVMSESRLITFVIASVMTASSPAHAVEQQRDGTSSPQNSITPSSDPNAAHRIGLRSGEETARHSGPGEAVDSQAAPVSSPDQQAAALNDTPDGLTPQVSEVDEIVVVAARPRGSVLGDIRPERAFSPLEVRAFGVTNIAELIEVLAPQVSSNRGREETGPITLLNGRRVSSFAEVSSIPAEAIERVEVFPEALALTYGYRADQKVVNVVTFERYSSRVGQAEYSAPTEGGRDDVNISANYFAIRDETRLNFNAAYSRTSAILESERGVRQPLDAAELGRFRSLLPETERLSINGVMSRELLEGVSSTFNSRFEVSEARSLLGLDDETPLRRDSETRIVQLGTTQGGWLDEWTWTLTGNYSRTRSETLSDAEGSAFRETARSDNGLANADLIFSGPIAQLPAGPVSASLRGGIAARELRSRSDRAGLTERTELSRDSGLIQGSISLPIIGGELTGRRGLGALSVNANFDMETLSDFGTLRSFGYGLGWSPIAAINLMASVAHEEGAPTLDQLGAPLSITPNARVFDFSRGEAVEVTRVSGGNAALQPDERQVVSLGVDAKPFASADFNVGVDFVISRIDNPIAQFPLATPEIETALPERFTRDRDGRLLAIDSRPVNFYRSDQHDLRWGFNYTRLLGSPPPLPPGTRSVGSRFYASEAEMRRKLPPGVQVVEVLPGSPAARRMETLSSRFFVSVYHSWRLKDELKLRDDGTVLDLLDGAGTDFRGGSRRHKLELQAGAFRRGMGARLSATWQSGTDLRGFNGSNEVLTFSDLTTININLFANLADQFGGNRAPQWLKGTRATLAVSNLLNSRLRVQDERGATPLNYQPAYLDPLGRSITFGIRKIF